MKPLFFVIVAVAALAIADVNARASNGIRSASDPVEDTEAPEPEPQPDPTTAGPTNPPATDAPTTSDPNPDPRPPQEGDDCDPELCRLSGYCQHYLRCDNSTRKLVREECGRELVWNPNGSGAIHGGNCDTWEAINDDLEARYRSDPECLKCFWRASGDCSPEYEYQAPNLRHRNVLRLSCSDGLVFSQEKETCQWKSDVPACGSGSEGNSSAAPAH